MFAWLTLHLVETKTALEYCSYSDTVKTFISSFFVCVLHALIFLSQVFGIRRTTLRLERLRSRQALFISSEQPSCFRAWLFRFSC